MQVITRANDIKISPRKVRLVADAIRSLSVSEALDALSVIQKRGARDLEKVLKSAIANALNNAKLTRSSLVIKNIDVSEGPVMKRYDFASRGHIRHYAKRTTNIRIVLEELVPVRTQSEEQKKEGEQKLT